MSPIQFSRTLRRLDLNSAAAARLLCVTEQAVRRWTKPAGERSARKVPPLVVLILRLIEDKKITINDVELAL